MKYKIICDYCENFDSKTDIGHVNDHQTQKTFEDINSAIQNLGIECEIFGGVPELISAYQNRTQFEPNNIFINLSDGTDKKYSRVQVPIICDLLNLKYSGGGPFEIALTSNKFYCSMAVRNYGLLTPKSILISNKDDLKFIYDRKSIVKPNSEGSSIGISDKSVCSSVKEISKQASLLLDTFSEVLVEEYIPGYDATCFVIGNESIFLNEVLSIKHHDKLFFDNEVMEYKDHIFNTRQFISCSGIIPDDIENKIKSISVQIKNVLNIKDFCRIDYRIDKDYNIYFLELNTVPAISMDSQVGVICNNNGISFENFMSYIIHTVTERFSHE